MRRAGRQRDDDRRRGLLPRQRLRRRRVAAHAWDSHREPRRAPTPSGCSTLFDEPACARTFFVLGWVAERYPALVRAIAAARPRGRVARLRAPAGLRPDAGGVPRRRAPRQGAARGRSAGVAVHGYRAPSYSITPRSLWALDVLIEEGYTYDASIFPIHHDRYGIPGVAAAPVRDRAARRRARRGAGVDGAARPAEPAGRRRRLLPAAAVRVDAVGHPARQQPRAAAGDLLPAPVGNRSRPAAPAAPAGSSRFRHYRNLASHRAAAAAAAARFRVRHRSATVLEGRAARLPRSRERWHDRAGAARPRRPRLASTVAISPTTTRPSGTRTSTRTATRPAITCWAGARVLRRRVRPRVASIWSRGATAGSPACCRWCEFRVALFGRSLCRCRSSTTAASWPTTTRPRAALRGRRRDAGARSAAARTSSCATSAQRFAVARQAAQGGDAAAARADAEALWTALDRKVRNQVRKAEKSGLAVETAAPSWLDDFYDVFARNMRDLGTPVYPRASSTRCCARFPTARASFVVRLERPAGRRGRHDRTGATRSRCRGRRRCASYNALCAEHAAVLDDAAARDRRRVHDASTSAARRRTKARSTSSSSGAPSRSRSSGSTTCIDGDAARPEPEEPEVPAGDRAVAAAAGCGREPHRSGRRSQHPLSRHSCAPTIPRAPRRSPQRCRFHGRRRLSRGRSACRRARIFLQRHRRARHRTIPSDEGLLADARRRVRRPRIESRCGSSSTNIS